LTSLRAVGGLVIAMYSHLPKYIAAFKTQLQATQEYRVNWLLSILCEGVPLLGILLFWSALFAADTGATDASVAGAVYGYSQAEVISYYIVIRVLNGWFPSVWWEVGGNIRSGHLSDFLTRPIDYLGYYTSLMLATSSQYILATAGVLAVVALWFREYLILQTDFLSWLLIAVSMVLGFALSCLVGYLVQLLAFWFEDTTGVLTAQHFLVTFASGFYFPLDFLPGWFHAVLKTLPFYYPHFFTTQLYLGRVNTNEALAGIGVEILWVAVLVVVLRQQWRIGLKRFSAVGG